MLARVLGDGAFAAAVLSADLGRAKNLDTRDRALATEIVYGALRLRRSLTDALGRATERGLPEKDPFVTAHLLSAAYQILALDRVPAHAAVDAAVEAVREQRGKQVAGFVNAVLRRLSSETTSFDREAAAAASAPEWLWAQIERAVGPEEGRALLGAVGTERRSAVRLVAGRSVPDWLEAAERGRVSPIARWVSRAGDLRSREGYAEGAFVVQEEGAQVVGLALGARPGERVLDACAGRGQKTSLLSERVGPTGAVWAADSHPDKLAALSEEHVRLTLPAPEVRAVDWTRGVADVPADFDRVLVDAPCSGTGTLVRRPEILLRLGEADVERLAATSEAILRGVSTRVRPGGRLVFSVCSVLERECEAVVEAVADFLVPAPFDAPEIASVSRGRSAFRLLPREHGTDGFFVASFVRPG